MKKSLITACLLFVISGFRTWAACATCGTTLDASVTGGVGINFDISMGKTEYGESAGSLFFSGSDVTPDIWKPLNLQFSAEARTDVDVVAVMIVKTNWAYSTSANVFTNQHSFALVDIDSEGTEVARSMEENPYLDFTNIIVPEPLIISNVVIRQVVAAQAVADIPDADGTNGYTINFYYRSQVGLTKTNGLYPVTGTPFVSWVVTNVMHENGAWGIVSEYQNVPNNGLIKQWDCHYAAGWRVRPLGDLTETTTLVENIADGYRVTEIIEDPITLAVSRQDVRDYRNVPDGGIQLMRIDLGAGSAPQTTTYSYFDPGTFDAGTMPLAKGVTNADGSILNYSAYNSLGLPTLVYSSLGDSVNGKYTEMVFDPMSAGIPSSMDDGTLQLTVPRLERTVIGTAEVSRRYTLFPSAYMRLDVQCTTPNAEWNNTANLFTTNIFYAGGAGQSALQKVIRPDGTMTTYSYVTNPPHRIDTVVSGAADSTYTHIIDGVSNQTVLNFFGELVSQTSYDVKTGVMLSSDTYADYDAFGRPMQVTHLDGTIEYTSYACCGLDSTTDRDGVQTQYIYDAGRRPAGFQKIYGSAAITYLSVLDAAGQKTQSVRIGSDNTTNVQEEWSYDMAGEITSSVNALGGLTTYARSVDPDTGGVIWTITNPDGGVIVKRYYADGQLKQVSGSGIHGARYEYGVDYDADWNLSAYTKEIKLKDNGDDSDEWTQTFTDVAGRKTEVLYADNSYSQWFYNEKGQLTNETDPDGVAKLYAYNGKGEPEVTAIDMNRDGTINYDGADRITSTKHSVVLSNSRIRTQTFVWDTDSSSVSNLISMQEMSADGLNVWNTIYRDASTPVTSHQQIVPGATKYETNTAPDGSYTVNTYAYGRLSSTTKFDSGNNQIRSTTFAYDSYGRSGASTDARNGKTSFCYNNADLVIGVTNPPPGFGQSPLVTQTAYNNMLQATIVTQPDNTSVTNVYLLTGELGQTSGSRTYPVGYTYDYAGRMKTMITWQDFSAHTGAAVTTWNYDLFRGFLTNKAYADGVGPNYTYTYGGRLQSRAWVRTDADGNRITTTYTYDNAGSLNGVSYSDSTPAIAYTYDRLGRRATASWNGITDTLSYNLANESLGESYSGGILDGIVVAGTYDANLRRTALSASAGSAVLNSTAYGYDNASRLQTVDDGNGDVATYTYVANSPLVGQIKFQQRGTTRMTTTKQYDFANRLLSISSTPSGGGQLPISSAYQYNTASQRTQDTLADGSYWLYQYDTLGQVISGKHYWQDGTNVAGQQFEYSFDTIGNRNQTKTGGDQTTANLRVANYRVNLLNQYTNRDVPGYIDILGASYASNTVTVAGQTAYRKTEYFRKELSVANSSTALWTNIVVSATGQSSVSGNVFVAQSPERFGYDADGNQTNDGRWIYLWDAENRLTNMTSLADAPNGSKLKLDFAYDFKGRRIQKVVSKFDGTNYVAQNTNLFIYDGWNLIVEVGVDNSLTRSCMWGMDLSGTPQGAGGVGGLLQMSFYDSTATTSCFLAYDGNGNVSGLVNSSNGVLVGKFEYGPFGEIIRTTGPMARTNPFRFSTKYQDDETGLLYFGNRFYDCIFGNWVNRDPVEESGGRNMYVFVGNNPISLIDVLGFSDSTLQPGNNANGSIPARSPARDFTPDERAMINQLGNNDGCHTCGTKNPGTKTGDFVPDHQPPSALSKPDESQRLYPQCLQCSRVQGGEVAAAMRAQRNARVGAGAAFLLLLLDQAANAMDSSEAAQDKQMFENAIKACENKAKQSGRPGGCACCVIGVIKRWTVPASPPNWIDRITGGNKYGHSPSGSSYISNVMGTYYDSPCDQVADPGALIDMSSTYESHMIPF